MSYPIKIGATLYWLAVLAALLFDLPPKVDPILILTGMMIGIFHVVEVIAVFTLLKDRLKPTRKDILPILMFGAFYLRPKLEATRS